MRNRNAKSALSAAVRLVAMAAITSEALGCGSSTGTSAEDAGRETGPDSSHPADASSVNACSGPVTEALIDDMTGASISFVPPPCATQGAWTVGTGAGGTLTTPAGNGSILGICGSLCESLYSSLPAGFPGTTAGADAGSGSADAPGGDGGTSAPRALCLSGQTAATQYSGLAWMTVEFAFSGTVPDGGPAIVNVGGNYLDTPPPALINASQYGGIQFWLWVSPSTVAPVTSSFEVCLNDKFDTVGAVSEGGCDPSSQGPTACGMACADISQSTAALSQSAGALLDQGGGVLTALSPGWQLVKAPWANFLLNPYYGGAIESAVDPTSLTYLSMVVQQDLAPDAGAAPIPFDFCVYRLAFYH